jgi:hypothetical protein
MKTLRNLYKKIMARITKFWKDHIIDEVHPDNLDF